jgi:hypothetical protein
MSKRERPPLGGIAPLGAVALNDDEARIRQFGLSRGFLPTDAAPPAPSSPPVPPSPPAAAFSPVPSAPPRPAGTKPWQAMFPDYLCDELRQAAAREGTAQKVVVMRALRQAGFRVDDLDLQDLRRR